MRPRTLIVLLCVLIFLVGIVLALFFVLQAQRSIMSTLTRDPFKQPFASTSIWNMPIGDEAVYVPANIKKATQWGMTVDEDILILAPDAPLTDIYYNGAGWSKQDRCVAEGGVLLRAPIPVDFVLPHVLPHTPNNSTAILMPDRRTLKQHQPFHRCASNGLAVTQYLYPDADLYGDGIRGAHGGSGLSSIGGTLRLGELIPGGTIRHALKINLFAARNLYYAADDPDGQPGYRWPAVQCDGYANDPNSSIRYGGQNLALQMGALLALHKEVDLAGNELGLETEPAKMLAQALQDYGAYVVDDTAWDVYGLAVEWGPDGLVTDEFQKAWGFSMTPQSRNTPWVRDMDRIFTNLYVIDNNGPQRIGGGGKPRQPLAAPLIEPTRP